MLTRYGSRWQTGLILVASLTIIIGSSIFALQRGNAKMTVAVSSYPWQPDDIKAVVNDSALVVEGVSKEVQSPRWTTPDGKAPTDLTEVTRDLNVQLRTPILLSVERTFKGSVKSNEVLFSIIGGSDANHKIVTDDDSSLTPGMRIVAFLGSAPADAGAWANISPLYPQLYFIVDGDTLHGPMKDVAKSSIEQQLLEEVN